MANEDAHEPRLLSRACAADAPIVVMVAEILERQARSQAAKYSEVDSGAQRRSQTPEITREFTTPHPQVQDRRAVEERLAVLSQGPPRDSRGIRSRLSL